MQSELYLFAAGIASFAFAAANFLFNEATVLPGWILLGVIFMVIGVAWAILGSDEDDSNGAEI